MAAEIHYRHSATGSTMRATIRKEQTVGGKAQMWAGAAWEDMTVANWATYLVTLTETPASSYIYIGTMPAVAVGWYYIDIYSGTAINSTLEATLFGYWNGTTINLGGADAREICGTVTAVPGAAGGVTIAGSNAATTFATLTCTGALTVSDGIVVTCSTDSKSAVKMTGGATAGKGLEIIGTGTGTSITATGAVSLSSTLTVAGTTTLAALTQTGAASLGAGSTVTLGTLAVTGATTLAAITQTGAASFGAGSTVTFGTLAVTGAVSFGSTLAVTGAVTAPSLTLSGAFQAATIVSTGTTTLNALTVTNAATLGTLTVSGATSLQAVGLTTLTASGAVALQSTLAVTGTTTLTGAVSLGSTLTVTGTTTLAAIAQTGTVGLGATTFASATITGELTVSNGIVVTCSTDSKSALKLTGGATAGKGLEVIGTGTGNGINVTGTTSLGATTIITTSGNALRIETTDDGYAALRLYGNSANSYGLYIDSGGGGDGLYIASSVYVSGQVTFVSPISAVAANDIRGVKIGGILANALPAESIAGRDAAAFGKLFDVETPVLTAGMYGLAAADTGATYVARAPSGTQTLDSIAASIAGIGSGTGAALNFACTTDSGETDPLNSVAKVGTVPTPTEYIKTTADNAVYEVITAAANAIDWVYKFSVGGGRVASKITFNGYLLVAGPVGTKAVNVYAWDWTGTPAWDLVAVIAGQTGTTDVTRDITLLSAYTGTGTNAGIIYLRFTNAGNVTSLNVDALIAQAQNLGQTVGYQDGCVWVDATSGTAGTTPYVNGTADNACTTIADAYTIATAVGLTGIDVAPGTTLTLTASADKWHFQGGGRIALGSQSTADAKFLDIYTVSGITTGDDQVFIRCGIGDVTIPHCYCIGCRMKGDFTLTAANIYYWLDCSDANESADTQTIIFAANAKVYARRWSGALTVKNMAAGNELIVDGAGRVVIDSTCSGGTINIRGNFPAVTDNVVGGFVVAGGTITQTARYATDQVGDAVWDEVLTAATHNVATSAGRRLRQLASAIVIDGTCAGATANSITLDADASAVAGTYDPALIYISGGTGAGQCRNILEYSASKVATVDRDWKVLPVSGDSTYVIMGDAGREHVNEGLCRALLGGYDATVCVRLNASASSQDDCYIGQRIFIRSGTGQDQSRRISDYDGSDQIATVNRVWGTQPDVTSGYVLLPTGSITDACIAGAVWDAATADHATTGTFGKALGDLVSRITANLFSGITYLAKWLGALAGKTADTTTRAEINATTAGAGYNETTDSLEANRDNIGTAGAGLTGITVSGLTAGQAASLAAIEADTNELQTDWTNGGRLDLLLDTAAAAGSGTGARAVVFTVTTGGVALQGASVRLYRTGSLDRTGTTNASGQVTLYCDVDATWSYAVTHALYDAGSGTVVVDGNEAVPVSLTALSWPASTEPDTVTIRWKVKLGVGRVTAGAGEATVYVRMKAGSGDAGFAYGTRQDSDATDANGYVYFANVPVGGTISAKLGSGGAEKVYEIAADATTPYDMGELIGDA